MKTARFACLLAIPTLGVICGLWLTHFPLGIPGEWVWDRIEPPSDLGLTILFAGIWAALFVGFVWAGATRIRDCRTWEVAAWLVGLTIAGFGWLLVAQDSAPAEYRFSKIAWVLYYPGSSGYFGLARDHSDDFDKFLSGYEQLMSEGDVLHVGTHPPGLIIGYHQLIETCRRFPRLRRKLADFEPTSLSDAFSLIEQNHRGTPTALLPEHRAAIWLAALLTQLAAATTVIPLYLLLRRDLSPESAWLTVSLWPAVPAITLFLPKSDVLYPLLGMLMLYAWMTGWERRSAVRCFLAGFVFCISLTCSLAPVMISILAGVLTLWRGWLCRPEERVPSAMKKLVFGKAWAAAGFLLPVLTFWFVAGVNLLNVWLWNYRNHAAFYNEYPRTYWKWLAINPLELAIAAGVPLTIAALVGIRQWGILAPRSSRAGIIWATLMVWGLLWLSGKNMGEAARLWIVLMPMLILMAAGCFSKMADNDQPSIPKRWVIVFVLQLLMSVLLPMVVHGFHFPDAPAADPIVIEK